MEWLAAKTDAVPLEGILGNDGKKSTRVTITFDDGYDCIVRNAFPVMKRLGMVGTVYLNTGWIGDGLIRESSPPHGHYDGEHFMSWAGVRRLAEAGWTIGSHGVDHVDLTVVDDNRMRHELSASKREIEHRLGMSCDHFAFTWGRFTGREKLAVQEAGYRTAASAIHGPLKNGGDTYALPRIDIANRYTLQDFEAIARGDWDYLGLIQRTRAWLRGRR